eukprot:PhM_4_TR16080/c6_g1_i1/m.38354/K01537/E3.6.3.8; Ca2+-transporting ATPase
MSPDDKQKGESSDRWAESRDPPQPRAEKEKKVISPEVQNERSKYHINPDEIEATIERKDMEKYESMGGVEALLKGLQSDPEKGINSASLGSRRLAFGWNKFTEREPVKFFDLILVALEDRMVQLLIVAAVISIIFGMTMEDAHTGEVDRSKGWIEGTAILISVSVVVLVGAGNDYQKAKKFEEIAKKQSIKMVQVIRDGHQITIDSTELVVGDVMVLETGQQFVADGFLISGQDIRCNESAMTGESDLIRKRPGHDVCFLSGTNLEEGSGKILIVAVGMSSFMGTMKEKTEGDSDQDTPLQIKLGIMADQIGKVGMIIAVVLFVALATKETVSVLKDDEEALASRYLRYIIVCVTVVVVCIPEGLPLAVTISLAYGMKSMMDDNCMVRIMASCETMGAATAICSDKTGTLTTNVMTVVQGYIAETEFYFSKTGIKPRHSNVQELDRANTRLNMPKATLDHFLLALAINSTAMQQMGDDGKLMWVGNKTEHGLLGFVIDCKNDVSNLRQSISAENKRQYPFSSAKKRMSTVVQDPATNVFTQYCKGASEWILDDCGKMLDIRGDVVDITPEKRQVMQDAIADMATQGNRTIAVSYCPLPAISMFPEEEPMEKNMIFMGVLGIQDPLRDAVPHAIEVSTRAGLTIRMVTGDNINTAIAIAKKSHIFEENGWDLAMTGPEFRDVYENTPEALFEIVPRLRVLARSSPHDKHVLVDTLQQLGEVVGVTGDGTNDAPALKLANVGFAMNTGTDIAKGAAHMILMDDNFATVVAAIKWGRAVNDNVRKFLQFQLAVNFAGVLLTFVGAISSDNNEEPLKPVQLLWL